MPRKKEPSFETEKDIFPRQLRKLMDREPKTTQPQLAKVLGVQRQTISNYAIGQSSPDWKTLSRIADYFNVSADWLLGRTDIESSDTHVQTVCHFTGLSEKTVELLRRSSNVSSVINELAKPDKHILDSQLYRFCNALLRVEKAAALAAIFVVSEDAAKKAVEASMKKDALELAVFHFSEVCRRIPDMYRSSRIIDLIDDQYNELYQKEFLQFSAESRKEEINHGEHQEN